ncbi:MAG: carbohydrate-binding family 9-like protein [Balneolaceae bacterium]
MIFQNQILLPAFLILLLTAIGTATISHQNIPIQENEATMLVKKTIDFTITGDGSAENWNRTDWVELIQRSNREEGNHYQTEFKVLYSETGIYILYRNEDRILNASFEEHFAELWHEDVVEAFFWTDESGPDYFEYELSPLNYELPLIVSNLDGELVHWIPFANSYHEESDRKTQHKTSVLGGVKSSGASIEGWIAEIFIPFKLMHPLKNIIPESGSKWRANFYRIDYDDGMTPYSWQPFETNFHDYKNFGTVVFE